MKRCLLTPVIENMTDTDIISSRGVLRTFAPARVATSASPVPSITRLARIASRPALLSVMMPRISPASTIGATKLRCSIGSMPASCTSTSATYLNISASSAWLRDCGSGMAAPMALARCSNSGPMPSLSTVASWRYQAKPSTPTCVMLPPKQPYRSTSVVLTPARADASAAARPPGPLPTTSTSVSWTTSISRAGSVILRMLVSVQSVALPWSLQPTAVPGRSRSCSAFQSIGFTSGTTTSQATRPHSATTPDTIDAEV